MFRYLSLSEKAIAIGFGVSVVIILSFATIIIGKWLGRAIMHRPSPRRSRRVKLARRGIVIVAMAILACLIYSFFEPYRLEITHVTVPTAKLPAGSRPIRIVHISDLHCDAKPLLEERAVSEIAALAPDIICFTGDAMNDQATLPRFQAMMTKLADIAPTFAVFGNWDETGWRGEVDYFAPNFDAYKNWDYDGWGRTDYYGPTGVQLLTGTPVRVLIDGQPVWIAGTPFYQFSSPQHVARALTDIADDEPVIFLHHYPSIILNLPGRGVDLCLSGHTHGGQLALPFYGALTTLTSTGKRFEAGLYKHEDTYLYVSRGLGVEGHNVPRIRFFARPEITVIELTPLDE